MACSLAHTHNFCSPLSFEEMPKRSHWQLFTTTSLLRKSPCVTSLLKSHRRARCVMCSYSKSMAKNTQPATTSTPWPARVRQHDDISGSDRNVSETRRQQGRRYRPHGIYALLPWGERVMIFFGGEIKRGVDRHSHACFTLKYGLCQKRFAVGSVWFKQVGQWSILSDTASYASSLGLYFSTANNRHNDSGYRYSLLCIPALYRQ